MTNKEALQKLVNEGKQAIATMSSLDDLNFVKWKEKTKTVIRGMFGEDSTEYREIKHIAPFILSAKTTSAEDLAQAKKDAQRKIAKLEVWAELEDE